MTTLSRQTLGFLFAQLALLILQPDLASSFGSHGRLSIRRSLETETSFASGNARWTKEISTARDQSAPSTRNQIQGTRNTETRLGMDIVGVSPEPIHSAFSFATFGPQPFWLLMILLPNNELTKKVMGKLDVVIFFCLVHFFIVSASIVQPGATAPLLEFNDVFDPAKDSQAAFMNMVTNYPNFVAEEWPHVLTWDLFVGRYIWLDGLKRGIFTSHSVLFANLIGPPGLLLHWVTCLVTGKGFGGSNEALEEE
mmetsp:Transcript_9443/g.28173  ORF Transcript_9443/g.28173 Transcript_9443/m.28173 type:complete len:253 (+) Transcript_9443:118-876(+)|eukprot:CAMPEP_0172368622 /NCGR_PEP_ID=MMETSP1060-20121228/28285_1 /TAXON_ID=37318 /ORGANISM="Pseudo-nitzschia pungens, Strain cf. cingulata" /LENGTH=252 /DNA_ID=CAMNT_0013093273 /DNA_START=48 /DNA_END=806 /DNA_ORIENTATION=+